MWRQGRSVVRIVLVRKFGDVFTAPRTCRHNLMNTFEANMAALASQNAPLASAVRHAAGGILTVAPARSGVPTATVEGRAIHSAYDPRREAEAWSRAQAAVCGAEELIVVLGVGLLYHVEALRAGMPRDTSVVVIVPDVNELHDACAARS